MWNLWVVNRADCKRERRKLGGWVESRMDAEVIRGLLGSLLSQRVVYAYDIALVSLEQGSGQLVPMCYCFQDFLST